MLRFKVMRLANEVKYYKLLLPVSCVAVSPFIKFVLLLSNSNDIEFKMDPKFGANRTRI